MSPIDRRLRAGLLLLFVLSGAAGLIYEVVWARQLVLVFGNTSQAVSTILTGFFGGLAIGGAIGGRVADRVARPLRMYGLLELVLVVIVVLTPVSFHLIADVYRGAYPALSGAPTLLALVRFALAILALGPATLLLGATLPTLTRFLASGRSGLAGAFQQLYAANTIGAIAGTAVGGFVLVELLGLTGALLVGAACSATAGAVALVLDWRVGPEATNEEQARPAGSAPDRAGRAARPPGGRRLALVLAFASGLTSLGYQVVWNRLLSAGTGSSTYVFTIILVLFLTGIAIGALLVGPLRRLVRSTVWLIGLAQLLTAAFVILGASVLASPATPFIGASPHFVEALRSFAQSTAIVVLPATIAIGVTFPATAALLGDEHGTEGAATGALVALNTLGAIVATFVLPFFVIPLIGSPATLAALALANVVVGGVLLSAWSGGRVSRAATSVAALAIAVIIVASTAGGWAFQSPTVRRVTLAGGTVLAATEDEIAPVVAGRTNTVHLWVNGTSMTVITVDTKLMPILPLALRPSAATGLVIAFGMGTAFRSSLIAGVRTEAVELVPSVPDMFHWYYADAAQVLADPRGRVVIADGRNHVELTSSTFDFIVVDPPPPIESSGVSVISSLEFYRAARSRLNPGGVMVQWVPYGQTLDAFLAHVRTFLAVFPNVNVVAGAGGYGFYMIGSDGPVTLDRTGITAALERPGVMADLDSAPDAHHRTLDDWVGTILGNSWASGNRLRTVVGDGPLVTDDRPLPEYFLLRKLSSPDAPLLSLGALRALLH